MAEDKMKVAAPGKTPEGQKEKVVVPLGLGDRKMTQPTGLSAPSETDDDRMLIRQADARPKTMEDFTSPDDLYRELIASIRKYHPSDDITLVEKAFRVADEAHRNQKRKSGEPYIIHPLCVAIILADLELDKETIAAGLLHDVVEDTIMTLDELRKEHSTSSAKSLERRSHFWSMASQSWGSCPTRLTSWRCRRRTSGRCFWLWPRISGSF